MQLIVLSSRSASAFNEIATSTVRPLKLLSDIVNVNQRIRLKAATGYHIFESGRSVTSVGILKLSREGVKRGQAKVYNILLTEKSNL